MNRRVTHRQLVRPSLGLQTEAVAYNYGRSSFGNPGGRQAMFADHQEFENEVRRLARLLWPAAQYNGAVIQDGRERDGVFETEEFVHIVECTVSRQKQKAEHDFVKIEKLIRSTEVRYPQKFVKGWFVTQDEPTPDQRGVFAKVRNRIVCLSWDQFRSKLVDARSYLSLRERYPFGSVRDPETGAADVPIQYIPMDIVGRSGDLHTVQSISDGLFAGNRYVLLGDYGAGKSATVREVFLRTASVFRSGNARTFPLVLNLRDHHGQTDPVEALERHARRIGFGPPESLVRAWRAGLAIIILDGFDEIATAGWAGKTKRLRDLRYRSMELIRGFVREGPTSAGFLVAGRAHFFDSLREMESALCLAANWVQLDLSEFTEDQVHQYLRKSGWLHPIPFWIPSRPLLLGYLASRGLLQQTLEIEAGSSPAVGWDSLLDRIAAREAEVEVGIDAGTVRRLIEHIATLARASADGLGPVTPDQITGAFTAVCGYAPDDRGSVLLQRLPGLGGHSSEDGARVFIDQDFAEVARGGAVFNFIEEPFAQQLDPEPWQNTLWPLGADLAAHRCHKAGFGSGKVIAALKRAKERFRCDTLCADVLLTLMFSGADWNEPDLFIKEVLIPYLLLDGTGLLNKVQFQDTIVGVLSVPSGSPVSNIPRFLRCHVGSVEGFSGLGDLPKENFVDVTVDNFENIAETTDAILSLSLPLGTRVLLTVLRKMFAQRGSGRRESGLYRGLDPRARQLVDAVLRLLSREGFAIKCRRADEVIWLPAKSSDIRRRALSILAAPTTSNDHLISQSRDLD